MSPEYTPERLSDFLSLVLKQKVKVLQVIPNEGAKLGDEKLLVLMDMVVQLDDGSIANLEIQKIGYRFPGERSACYSADLLLRQYKKVRSMKGKKFTYRDVKPVYSIVLFEKSPAEYKKFPNTYIHYAEQQTDTGLDVELLQKYVFVPLDIFRKIFHNRGISNRLEAWLAFLCEDDPEWVIRLSSQYPEFRAMYEQAYDLCLNVEKVMEIFSRELYEIDKNTVQFMIDEMQEEINQKNEVISQKDEEISRKDEAMRIMTKLTRRLTEDGRSSDLLKALEDEVYRQQLLEEYKLISVK